MVVNAPNANTVAAAEHGIALLLAMARNVVASDSSMREVVEFQRKIMTFSSNAYRHLMTPFMLKQQHSCTTVLYKEK